MNWKTCSVEAEAGISKLRRFAGVKQSAAKLGARSRNPERSEGSPSYNGAVSVHVSRIPEVEGVCAASEPAAEILSAFLRDGKLRHFAGRLDNLDLVDVRVSPGFAIAGRPKTARGLGSIRGSNSGADGYWDAKS